MNLRITLLWINALLFIGFGVGFIIAPTFLSLLITETAPGSPNAVIDMRATYGGMALGVGLFLVYSARRPGLLGAGLLASLLVLSGIAAGRLVGIFVDGSPNGFMLILLAAELVFAGLFAVALKRTLN